MTRQFTMTEPIHSAATLIRELGRLKLTDATLLATATPAQRPSIKRAIARRRTLYRALQRWLSAEVRAQRGQLPIGDGWDDD